MKRNGLGAHLSFVVGLPLLLLVAALSVVSCGASDGDSAGGVAPDAVLDVDGGDEGSEALDPEVEDSGLEVDPDADEEVTVSGPRARVFRVEAPADLLEGFNARAEVGDFRLENEHAVFVIRGSQEPASWGPYGGNLIDAAARHRAPSGEAWVTGPDLFGEFIPLFGTYRAFRPRGNDLGPEGAFEILSDGSDGGAAVLRVRGRDGGIPLFDAALATKALALDITMEYRLEPDTNALEIRAMVTNTAQPVAGETATALQVFTGDLSILGDRLRVFYDGPGLGLPDDAGVMKMGLRSVLALGEGVGYALIAAPGESFSVPLALHEFEMYQYGKPKLDPGETVTSTRYMAVSDGATPALVGAVARLHELPAPVVVSGRVEGLTAEIGPRDVQVIARDEDEHAVALSLLDDSWGYACSLPGAGRYHFEVRVERHGHSSSEAMDVPGTGLEQLSLSAPAIAILEVGCTELGDATESFLPCRVSLQSGYDAPLNAGVAHELYGTEATHRFAVPPGAYTVTLSRGFEYELVRQNVDLSAGEVTGVEGQLLRSVDTSGWVATVVHVHSEFSIDSDLPIDERLRALAASGMEFVYPTEHDVFVDYQPFIEQSGLASWLQSDVGAEISSLMGHFNCLGCRLDPHEFAVPWVAYDDDGNFLRKLEAPEIWKTLREDFDASLIQINHPNSTQAFFDYIGFNAEKPVEDLVGETFSLDFDTLEIHNSHDSLDDVYLKNLPDWYSLLNQGVRRTGVGAEDTHNARGTGTPRSLVRVAGSPSPEEQPGGIDPLTIAEAIRGGEVVASQGPFPQLWINGAGIGEETTPEAGLGAEVTIQLRVQAPAWMRLGSARLIRNGEVIEVIDLDDDGDATAREVLRLDSEFTRVEEGPAWYVLLVEGDDYRLGPLHTGDSPFAITNPVFVGPAL